LLLNQNYIIGFVGAVALVTIGYLVYQNLLLSQNNWRMKCLLHKKTFNKLHNGVASDSLYKLSLNGSEGKFDLKLRMSILE
jgi:hypothetical protein